MPRFPHALVLITVSFAATASVVRGQRSDFERPPIDYHAAPVHDPVAQLSQAMQAGQRQLEYEERGGYLRSLLEALQVPVSSQTLVFSKTSLQLRRISPGRPRALYFNDDVYVGWCQQGEVIELAATDPQQGAIFYTLDQQPTAQPTLVRDRGQCLTCHASSRTQDVPGYLMRSVFADSSGHPLLGSGTYVTDDTSPFQQRWGGWYVTGTHGSMRHMGNQTAKGGASALRGSDDAELDLDAGANRESLDGILRTDAYLAPGSDIVALMVLQHQTQMHNAITAANFETRQALHQTREMNRILERDEDYLSESAVRRIDAAAEQVVRRLLLVDEYPLTDRVKGSSSFADDFQSTGPFDAQGRSLRQLDLKSRLFRYPCSYLIYSAAFDGLPDEVRQRIMVRMREILEGRDSSEAYAHLSGADRRAILEILQATKSEFAAG